MNFGRKSRMLAALAVATVLVAGCSDDDDGDGGGTTTSTADATTTIADTTTTADSTTTSGAGDTTTTTAPIDQESAVSVYFLQGEQLMVGEARAPQAEGELAEALRALLEGPTDFEEEVGLTTAIPEGTELLGVEVVDGIARVDLSGEFESGGGSLSMQARIAQVVFTATQFDQVSGVEILIDGEEVEAIGGEGLVVDQALSRDDFEFDGSFGDAGLAPPVLLESPRLNAEVESPVRLTGSANVFEATFQVEIVDGDGLIVYEDFVMASSGTGERGTFDVTVEFEPETTGLGAIITFVFSAEDGSRQEVREIPVRIS